MTNPYFENIPQELKELDQWLCWREVQRGNGKPDKVPVDPNTGGAGKSNDPSTWGTYDQAVSLLERNSALAGLGFVFTENGKGGKGVMEKGSDLFFYARLL